MPTPVEPWERQPGETAVQFAAFIHYRDSPLHGNQRTLTSTSQYVEVKMNRIKDWAKRNGWYDRAAMWDDHQDREWRSEVLRDRHRVARRQARAAQLLQEKALAALANINIEKLSPMEIVAMIKQARDLELGIYGSIAEDEVAEGSRPPIIIPAELMPVSFEEPVVVEPDEGDDRAAGLRAVR